MKNILKMGIGLSVGTAAMNKIGKGAPIGIMNNINSAMDIGSIAMPIYATKKLMKSTKKLI